MGLSFRRFPKYRLLVLSGGQSGENKAALIVSQDIDYGMSRMYQILMEDITPGEISVFKNIDEAEEWIEDNV